MMCIRSIVCKTCYRDVIGTKLRVYGTLCQLSVCSECFSRLSVCTLAHNKPVAHVFH